MPDASTIRVVEQSADKLVLYEPPYYPFGFAFVGAGLALAIGLFFFMQAMGGRSGVKFLGCVLALPFLFFGVKALTSTTLVEMSQPQGTLTIRRSQFGSVGQPQIIPLDDVVRATELRARRSYAAGLQLRSGPPVAITRYGDQAGKPAMIGAINQFLALRARRQR